MAKKYFIGVDVGGTKIYGGLVSATGQILSTHKLATPAGAGVKEISALILKMARTLTLDADVAMKMVTGVGVAIPGIVDNQGKVLATPNLKLGHVDLKKVLAKKLGIKKIAIGNDANLGVLGERWLGAGRKAENIVGIFPGTGVGGGVIIKNEFMTGTSGAAAELGHVMVDSNGPQCTCGNKGCLEAIAGRWAIERDIRAGLKKGRKSALTRIVGKDVAVIKSSSLSKALKAKDKLVIEVMTRAADALGEACVSLNHIFNPDMFLFGGGVIEACGDFILPRVEKALAKDPFFKKLPTPKVANAKLGDDAVMLGAVAMIMRDSGVSLMNASYFYPPVRVVNGDVLIKNAKVTLPCYLRADGKVKTPQKRLPTVLGPGELTEMLKKGPDRLIIAKAAGTRTGLSAKGLSLLKKKKVVHSILPLAQAVRAFNASRERRVILFC